MDRRKGLIVAPLVVLMMAGLTTGTVSAQIVQGSLRGEVVDTTGAAIPGATMEVSGPALVGGSRTTVTDEKGQYRFPLLPPGTYTLTATVQGFQTVKREGIRVEVGTLYDVNFTLELGSVVEAVTVKGAGPIIDSSRAAMTTNLTSDLIEATPTSRFFFLDLAFMAPGVGRTRFNNTAYRAVAFGSSVNENMFIMDGANITGPQNGVAWMAPGQDLVEEVEIVGLGATAEYGNFQGAVFNVVTKSGSNSFHGDANYFWQTQKLTANNAEINGIPFHRDRYSDFSFQVGGPIKADKLRYFGSIARREDSFSEAGVPPDQPAEQKNLNLFGKLTWQINKDNTLMGSFYYDPSELPSAVTVTNPKETITAEVEHHPTPNIAWTSVLGQNTLAEIRYSGFYAVDYSKGFASDPNIPGHQDVVTGVSSVNANQWFDGDVWRTNVNTKLSHYVADFLNGSHDTRIGWQLSQGGDRYARGFPGGRFYFDRNGQPDRVTIQNATMTGGTMFTTGIFGSDTWRLGPRATVNLGLRFDHSTGTVPDYDFLDENRKPTGEKADNPGKVLTWNVISPRLGLSYMLQKEGRTVARAHFGRFYSAPLTRFFSDVSVAAPPQTVAQWNGTEFVPLFTIDTNVRNRLIDPNLKAPYSDQFSLGLDHELVNNFSVGVTFLYKKWHDLIGRERSGPQYAAVTRTYTDQRSGQPVVKSIELLNQINDPANDIVTIKNRSIFHQDYKAFILTLNKRMANNWMILGTYTRSISKGLTTANVASSPYDRQEANIGAFGSDPNELINADGFQIDDRPHMFKAQYSIQLPWAMQVSGDWELLTGKPIFPRVTFGLRQGNVNVFIEPRDGDILRAPTIQLFSVRVQKDFALTGSTRLRLGVDTLDVFNSDSFYNVRTTLATSTLYGQGSTFVPPRRAMLSARFMW
jgi:hypothetical protein